MEFPLHSTNNTVFAVLLKIQVKVHEIIVVNCLHVLTQLTHSRLKTSQPVLSELVQLVHEPLALVINQIQERSVQRTIITDLQRFRLL